MEIDRDQQAWGRQVWSSGNWDEVAPYIAQAGPPLLDAVGIEPGIRLLDVGAGSGGAVSIPAAQRGARVVASDLVGDHFEAGRRRAAEAGVEIEWVEADALELPFEDDSFDRVCSTFGHMFAPDHALAAAEMIRVCRPGGAIGFCCWTPEGVIGEMFRIMAPHMPPPPEGFQPPSLWGSEDHVKSLFDAPGVRLSFERRMNVFEDESIEAYNEHMETHFGPILSAKAALGDDWPALSADFDEFLTKANLAADGSLRYEGEYLQTVARLPG